MLTGRERERERVYAESAETMDFRTCLALPTDSRAVLAVVARAAQLKSLKLIALLLVTGFQFWDSDNLARSYLC